VQASQEDLEQIFWPFLDPAVRRIIRNHAPRRSGKGGKRIARSELAHVQKDLHIFDKRRLYFLRYGSAELREMSSRPMRVYNRLLEKSRDEIEQMIEGMEPTLRQTERRAYTYFIFDLQRFFSSPLARRYPQAMDPDVMDEAFLEEVCRLQADKGLFPDQERADGLDPVLVRYVIMYFDNEFQVPNAEWDYVQDFMRRHRGHRRPVRRRPRLGLEEACKALDIDPALVQHFSLKQLAQQYRKKALECHPDQGGTHEQFISLTRAYKDLLTRKLQS
jgi:phage-related protein